MNEVRINIPENFAIEEAGEFRDRVYVLIDKGEKHFSLYFDKCSFIDSTGLGVLVSLYKKCNEINGSLKLHKVNPPVMRIFKLTRLDSIFNIKDI